MDIALFSNLIDLASEDMGGEVLAASDDFFAEMDNLIRQSEPEFIAGKYTDRGKWMDGWETRRRRTAGHDWCIVKLGLPGRISAVDIDTRHFLGNHPPYAALDACEIAQHISRSELPAQPWTEILPRSPLRAGSRNLFSLQNGARWTHVRLRIYPDGGVARLRIFGTALPDFSHLDADEIINVAALENGGRAVACSDMFFSNMNNLLRPGPAKNMADGWETRRRRGPGNDWVIIKLGAPVTVEKIEISTAHFKGNSPESCSVEGCYSPLEPVDALNWREFAWERLLPQTRLQADKRHSFTRELQPAGLCDHVKLNIFPDGGIARLRVWGKIEGTPR